MLKSKVLWVFGLFFVLMLTRVTASSAQYVYNSTPLKQVIADIQNETGYYFLYRESQIADIKVTMESSSTHIFEDLATQLLPIGLAVRTDHLRMQVILIRQVRPNAANITISGQIVDALSGERLPYATISWVHNGQLNGVISNTSGNYVLHSNKDSDLFELHVSYIGYKKQPVFIDLRDATSIEDLTIRLIPQAIRGQEIVINDYLGYHASDTLVAGIIDAGRFSPLGGSNTIRALQALPSVTAGTAINAGVHVRGSTPDGFLVLLDGMTMFNQSHLFGLLDSFNSDAIQSAGYYIGVTPAHIETPTGGTLNLLTRTGSRSGFQTKAGLTNTSYNATVEGPMGPKASWLFSLRSSYMNQVPWFNNKDLIQWGLDIDRPRKIAVNEPDYTNLVLKTGDTSARFVDLHTKLYLETKQGGRWILSGYLGGDETRQNAKRRTRSAGTDGNFVFLPVSTQNVWGNALISANFEKQVAPRWFSKTLFGASSYETSFSKDDFVYSLVTNTDSNQSIALFTYPFGNESAMTELKGSQELEFVTGKVHIHSGTGLRFYSGTYTESSFDRPSFYAKTTSILADMWVQTTWKPYSWTELHTGNRTYFYSEGNHIRFAPRAELRLRLVESVQLSAGYSRTHQFLHKVSLENATTADVWILSSATQPPASSSQYTAGVEWKPASWWYIRADIYRKTFEDLRVHELSTQTLENTFLDTPWYSSNDGESEGIELLSKTRWNRFTLTQTYTRARVEFNNPYLYDGEPYYADWDRTHTLNTVLESQLTKRGRLFISWLSMSGTPNSLAIFGNVDRQRLSNYNRLDISLQWSHALRNANQLEWSISVYNALNTENVWYRNYAFSFDETRLIPRLRAVPVDVLDLGFQPSFMIRYRFE
jgi:hypothetical protein